MDRCLIKKSEGRLGLEDIDELTIPEIAFFLDWDDSPRPMGGKGRCLSHLEAFDGVKAWERLTPRQRLERLKAGG